MTLRLQMRSPCSTSMDASGLIWDRIRSLSLDGVRRIPLAVGRQQTALGDLFQVSQVGSWDDARIEIEGDCSSLIQVAARQTTGEIVIAGHVGDWLGRHMRGGKVVVLERAGDYVGSGMRGGEIVVNGSAGAWVGAPARGERTGMRGGQIAIQGDVGEYLGYRMRRGWILVAGEAAEKCAQEIIAGTVVVSRLRVAGLAIGMQRGTILTPQSLESQFKQRTVCGFTHPMVAHDVILRLMQRHLRCLCASLPIEFHNSFEPLMASPPLGWHRVIGDMSSGGQGEIIWN